MTANIPVITIDGPGGAGKGTLCKAMAEALGWHLLDSGAIYRVLALAALHHHVDVESEEALVPLAAHIDVRFISTDGNLEVVLEGEDVSSEIRTQEVANAASKVAAFPRVREAMLRRQRAFRELPGLIADNTYYTYQSFDPTTASVTPTEGGYQYANDVSILDGEGNATVTNVLLVCDADGNVTSMTIDGALLF